MKQITNIFHNQAPQRSYMRFNELIHIFKQFEGTEPTTTTQKFLGYKGDYENDLKTMITY